VYVVGGNCPFVAAFSNHCFFAPEGNSQASLNADKLLYGNALYMLVVPFAYEDLIETQDRAHQPFIVGCKLAADAKLDLSKLFEDDASNSDEGNCSRHSVESLAVPLTARGGFKQAARGCVASTSAGGRERGGLRFRRTSATTPRAFNAQPPFLHQHAGHI